MKRRDLISSMAAATTVGLAATATAATTKEAAANAKEAAANAKANPSTTGARNLITDVPGLKVGNAQDSDVKTGVTVIIPDVAAVTAVDVRGGGPATRETDALSPENLVQVVDGIVLSGGSVYGMASADGVCAWMGARNRGFSMGAAAGVPPSPILPTACLYDLANGGNKDWKETPPYRDLGMKAFESIDEEFSLGTAGAGYGANSGGIKGGLGSASVISQEGINVGAIVAVNSLGAAIGPDSKQFWAAPFEMNKEFGGLGSNELRAGSENYGKALQPRGNTTIAVIATDIALTRVEMQRVAMMAQDGLARALRPVHAPFDGDVVFAMSTAQREVPEQLLRSYMTMRIGALAADTLARAVARAIFEATALEGSDVPAWRDL